MDAVPGVRLRAVVLVPPPRVGAGHRQPRRAFAMGAGGGEDARGAHPHGVLARRRQLVPTGQAATAAEQAQHDTMSIGVGARRLKPPPGRFFGGA